VLIILLRVVVSFLLRAETLRLGRKGCTMRMTMLNDEAKPIATAIASYAF
jgi:acyl-coenzyme A thioesterase PaaI-like protein